MTSQLPRLLELQRARNSQTRGAWEYFAEHRRQVMKLLSPSPETREARLYLWGAGNCNDVDLAALRCHYAWIELVDWDAAALEDGVRRQSLAGDEQIVRHGGVDVTTIAADLSAWHPDRPPDDDQINQLCSRAASAPLPTMMEPVDTAASLCLVSQLVDLCALALGTDHPRLADLIGAVRLGHLRQLAGCLRPGGRGVICTDLVSSDTVPDLANVTAAALPPLLQRLLGEGNFFRGLHPQAVLAAFRGDPLLRERVTHCRITEPWLWQMGPRIYAAYAVVFQAT